MVINIFIPVAASSEEDPGFFEKLYTYVVNNIQVRVICTSCFALNLNFKKCINPFPFGNKRDKPLPPV